MCVAGERCSTVNATVILAPATLLPTADTSRLITSPALKVAFASVTEPSSEVPLAAIENVAATVEPIFKSAVSAEPVGAVVTATYAPRILPLNGIAAETILLDESVPGIVSVSVSGLMIADDILSPRSVVLIIVHYEY